MEYLEEAKVLIFNLAFLTPDEMCYLCTEVAKIDFADWNTCERWIKKSAFAILESDIPGSENIQTRRRVL